MIYKGGKRCRWHVKIMMQTKGGHVRLRKGKR